MKNIEHVREEIFKLYSEIDLNQLLDKIAEKIKFFLDCEEASIFIYNPIKEELYFEIATGEKGRSLKEIKLKKGEGIAGQIAEHRKPLIINDCARDPRFATRVDKQTRFITHSILGIPINMSGSLLGVMEAINKRHGKFASGDQKLLEGIAQYVGIPLQNAILFKKILQETKEKEQLLLLGKKISAALNYNEIFSNLKKIIFDILNPLSIRIYVKPEKRLYDLITGAASDVESPVEEGTHVSSDHIHFPLHTGRGDLGFLEIISESHVPEMDASLIRGLASFLAIAIEKFGLYQQMVEKERVTRELQIAREIQESFLIPPGLEIPGMSISYLNISSSEVGGDYYEILPLPQKKVILSVNDVSGHGIPASLLMSIFRSTFIFDIKMDPDLKKTLSHINDMIAETTQANLYVTSFSAMADLERMNMIYVNAGHPAALLFRGGQCRDLSSNSIVIGLMPNAQLDLVEIPLQHGDLLVLYTDGVIEAENPEGQPFGSARLISFFSARKNDAVEMLKEGLIAELKRFTETDGFTDDVTLIITRILPSVN